MTAVPQELVEAATASADLGLDGPRARVSRKSPTPMACLADPDPAARVRIPTEVARLVAEQEPVAREAAWQAFVSAHTRLILQTAHYGRWDHDAAMERYTYVLQQLRRDDFRRLRMFVADGRAKFTTWLVVVSRRLCLDYERQRYGRSLHGAHRDAGREMRRVRRRLTDLVPELDPDSLEAPADTPEASWCRKQLLQALEEALAALSGRDRLLIKLRFEDGLSAARLAPVLSLPTPFHVYRRLDRVLGELRAAFLSRGIVDAEP